MEIVDLTTREKALAVSYEDSNPRALINIVPDAVREAIDRIPDEFLEMTEDELEKHAPGKQFDIADRRIRSAFWAEYARAQQTVINMNMTNVVEGICSRKYFYQKFLLDPLRVAYMLTQPLMYMKAIDEALTYGMERLRRDILPLPLYDNRGNVDARAAKVVVDATKWLYEVKHGSVVQRTINKNLNVNLEPKAPEQHVLTEEEIDRQLAELEEKTRLLSNQRNITEIKSEGEKDE
jgi:hypothetical protein